MKLKKIVRNENVINKKKDLEFIHSIKKFPVFMGTTDKRIIKDLKFDMNFYIGKSNGVVQLNPILPFSIIYKESHNSGLVGKLWMEHHEKFSYFIKKFNPKNILEIGGGHGILSKLYQGKNIKTKWTIIEPNPSPIKGCKAIFKKKFFTKKDIINFDYDLLVHSHVLEHIFYPDKFINDIGSALSNNQLMVFSIPNLKAMINRNYTNALNFEHTTYLSEDYLDFILNKNSFKIIKKLYFKKDHSIFYAVKKINNFNKFLKINLYKKNKNLFLNYFRKQKKIVKKINQHINKSNKKIFLFGAHVFSQYLISYGLNTKKITYILDNDKKKQEKRLYGTKFIIKSPKILANYDKPLVILRAGVYNKEIKNQILKEINKETSFI